MPNILYISVLSRCRDRIIVLFISIYSIDSYDKESCETWNEV